MSNEAIKSASTNAAAGFIAGRAASENIAKPFTIDTTQRAVRPMVFEPEGAELADLSEYMDQPRRLQQVVSFLRPGAFGQYLNIFGQKDRTIVFADRVNLRFKAVLDYHASPTEPSWNGHVATFTLQKTDDWSQWLALDKKPQDQTSFAVFLEEHAHNIVEPDAGIFAEMALNFDAKKDTKFRSHRRLTDGSVDFQFTETLTNGNEQNGSVRIPEKFTLAIALFEGTQPVKVEARLRYRIAVGDLKLHYELITPERVVDVVFEAQEKVIAQATPEHVRAVIHGSV